MGDLLPPPDAFGFENYTDWRPHQSDAVEACTGSPHRFTALVAPTGSGKSLTYLVSAHLQGLRAVILTSTKGLQTQLARDYASVGLVDMRGRNNYLCRARDDGSNCEDAPCTVGCFCGLRRDGCDYYDALRAAQEAPLVVTNYAFWMAAEAYMEEGLGARDLIVCDEAHNAPEAVAAFLTVQFSYRSPVILPYLDKAERTLLDMTMTDWITWARETLEPMGKRLEDLQKRLKEEGGGRRSDRKEFTALSKLYRGILRVARVKDANTWVCTVDTKIRRQVQLAPIWPGKEAENVLFLGRPRVLTTSATVCAKTLQLLGIPKEEYGILEYPHTFPKENRLLLHIPTIRLNYQTSARELKYWVSRIDQIIRRRLDRKGIIHTISYKRRDFVVQNSEYSRYMITHNTKDAEETVRRFKEMPAPAILVSPSMSTGWDFPYSECEYQIIGKIPYPDTTDKLTKARCRADKTYAAYIAMQELVQACGRGVRAPDDRCETFIIDDNVKWFIPRNRDFAPKWFAEAFDRRNTIPIPPPPLTLNREE